MYSEGTRKGTEGNIFTAERVQWGDSTRTEGFMFCYLDCQDDKINKMGETCSIHRTNEKYIGGFGWKKTWKGRLTTRKT